MLNAAGKIFFILIVISMSVKAQTEFKGTSFYGAETDPFAYEKSLGAVIVLDAAYPKILNGTNIVAFPSAINGLCTPQYQSTNQPYFVANATTNNFPALHFFGVTAPTDDTRHLRYDQFASMISGNKPFTIVCLVNAHTNFNNQTAWNLGYTAAANAAGSRISLRAATNTYGTSAVEAGSDTNTAIAALNRSGMNTNSYYYSTVFYSGSDFRIMVNKTVSTTSLANSGTMTLNQFTIGLRRGINGTYATPFDGYITYLAAFTNDLRGTSITNFLDYVNTKKYPVF